MATSNSHHSGTATESAYERLKEMILSAELSPGSELREAALAEQLHAGRTPMREALRRLVQEGLVEVRPRQGYRVAPLTLARVRDLFERRMILEPTAVELATERASAAEMEQLGELALETYEAGDPARYLQFLTDNRELHVRIAEAGGNAILARTLRVLLDDMHRLLALSMRGDPRSTEKLHDHRDLYEAMLARDPQRARQIVEHQIEESRSMVMAALLAGSTGPSAMDLISLEGDAGPSVS
jgi:DNA-binding GntR family transcriptional regulator